MKAVKNYAKRSLAVFLALLIAFGTLNLNAFASTGTSALTCQLEEHTHDEFCYETAVSLVCGLEEAVSHTHDDLCYTVETYELVCELEEAEGHAHGDDCFETVETLICEDVSEDHTHGSDCYTTEVTLTCTLEEAEGHAHDSDCYVFELITAEEPVCGLEETEGHTHGDECYVTETSLICGKAEHTHTDECYSAAAATMAANNGGAVVMSTGTILCDGVDVTSEAANNGGLFERNDGNHAITINGTWTGRLKFGSGNITITGGTIDANKQGSAIIAAGTAKITLNGVTIKNGTGTLIQREKDSNNNWLQTFTVGSTKNVTDTGSVNGYMAIIATRTGVTCGGGILLLDTSELIMNSGSITDNSAAQGGGICSFRGTKVTIKGGSITNNTANGYGGGGMFLGGENNTIDPTEKKTTITISGNKTYTGVDLGGGGIFVDSAGSLSIVNAVIHDNKAGGLGGGVAGCLHGMVSTLSSSPSAVYSNTAGVNENGAVLSKPNTTNNVIDHDGYVWKDGNVEKAGGQLFTKWDDGLNRTSAADYFVAGYSLVGSSSLGGGVANWEGYAMARPTWADFKAGSNTVYGGATDHRGTAVESKYTAGTPSVGRRAISTSQSDPIVVQGLLGLHVTNPGEVAAATSSVQYKVNITGNYSNMHGGGVGTNGILTFGAVQNTYSFSKITFAASKNVTGAMNDADGAKNDFTFKLTSDKDGNDVLATAKSGVNGNISFDALLTSRLFGNNADAGTFNKTLYLQEVSGNKLGMSYDKHQYEIVLTVTRTKGDPQIIQTTDGTNSMTVTKFTDKVTSVTVDGKPLAADNIVEGTEEQLDGTQVPVFTVKLTDGASFTNKMEYGKLTLTKVLSNPQYNDGTKFSFTIKIGTDTFNEELAANDSWTSGYYPVGTTYTITEGNKNGYQNETGTITGTIKLDGSNEIVTETVTNTRLLTKLTVKKSVDYNKTTSKEPNADDTFTIVVTLGNGSVTVDLSKNAVEDETNTYKYVENGVYTFTLKDGESAVIDEIPTNTRYTVTETTPTAKNEGGSYTNTNASDLPNNEQLPQAGDTVEVKNHYYQPKYTNVTVNKSWAGAGNANYLPESITVQLYQGSTAVYLDDNGNLVEGENPVVITANAEGKFTHTWNGLPQYTGDNGTAYTYTVKEVKITYSSQRLTDNDWRVDHDDDGIIRVRHKTDNGEYEIIGGWRVSNGGTVNAVDSGTIIITNTWLPATEDGVTSLTIHKVDAEFNGTGIDEVWFELTWPDGATDTKQTANGGVVVFDNLTDGTYTLTEKTPANGYLHNTTSWTIEIVKNGLASVELIGDSDSKVGVNHWNWKPQGDGISNGTLTVTNTAITGSISVTKRVDLDGETAGFYGEPATHEFEFEVVAVDVPHTTAESKWANGNVIDSKKVTAGNKITFDGLRYGTYLIREVSGSAELTDYENWFVTYEGDETYAKVIRDEDGKVVGIQVEVKGKQGDVFAVEATNHYERKDGALSISKTVTGDLGNPNREWNFTVTLTSPADYVSLLNGNFNYTYVITDGNGVVKSGTLELPAVAQDELDGSMGVMPENALEITDVNENGSKIEFTITLKHGQTATISGIPVGTTYKVVEVRANRDGYTTKVTGATGTIVENDESLSNVPLASFINRRSSIELSVSKEWVGDDDHVRPTTIQVQLYHNNVAYGTPVTLSAEDGWVYSWTGLDNTGTWTVEEVNVPEGYARVPEIRANGDRAWVIVNTYTESLTTDITVNKVWLRDNPETRPGSITVQLYRSNEPYGEPVVLTEDADGNWTYTWYDLDVHEDWSVLEVNVPDGYDATYSRNQDGTVLTITNTGAAEVTVTKEWDDEDDADGIRPESVTVQLWRGMFLHDTVTLDESNNWSYTWSNLPLGYDYRVVEVDVPEGYDASYDQDGDVWTITNTHTPDEDFEIPEDDVPLAPGVPQGPNEEFEIPEDDVPLASVPKTGDESRSWGFFAMLSGIGLALMALFRKKEEDSAE